MLSSSAIGVQGLDLSLDLALELAFGLPGGYEWLVLLVLGLLIFGRRLPDVGRSVGRSIVEFKRGIKGIEDEIDSESSKPAKLEDTFKRDLPEEEPGSDAPPSAS